MTRTGTALIALMLSALTGCAPPPARILVPGQAEVTLPNEAVIFGKLVHQVDGEIREKRADVEYTFDLIPFKDTGRGDVQRRNYRITVGKEAHFYSVVERDSYVIGLATFGNVWSRDNISCDYFGFHMPERAAANYVGTLIFDMKGILWFPTYGTIRIRDEFEEALKMFKRRNPEFTGKIVKSLVFADKSVFATQPPWKGAKPSCQELKIG